MPKVYVRNLCVVVISSSPLCFPEVTLCSWQAVESKSYLPQRLCTCKHVCVCVCVFMWPCPTKQLVLSGSYPSAPGTKYTGLLWLARMCGHCLLSTQLLADRAWPIYHVKLFWCHIWQPVSWWCDVTFSCGNTCVCQGANLIRNSIRQWKRNSWVDQTNI